MPVAGGDEEKQTNEIRMVEPLLRPLDLDGMTITADAPLTQRTIAKFLVEEKRAHYHFIVKANQKNLLDALETELSHRNTVPDSITCDTGHGRIETRKIWVTQRLNDYLDFPHVRQAFVIERHVIHKKTDNNTVEIVYGITSADTHEASPTDILNTNRGHWCIESHHHMLDVRYDEDRGTLRTGYGPENMTCLRRFAISSIISISKKSVAETIRKLNMNTRMVFDYLKMTANTKSMTYELG